MSSDAGAMIQAVHAVFDEIAPLVEKLTPEQLTGPSGASEWTVADVLSHLGSGAVIGLGTLNAALTGESPAQDNQAVWDRWNAMPPPEQANEFLAANRALIAAYDSIDDATRESQLIDMGFLPEPVPLAVAVRFRLGELAMHAWDVKVAFDPGATLQADAVPLLFAHAEFMLGWIAKPANLPGRSIGVELHDPARTFGLVTDDSIAIGELPVNPDATLKLPAEAWLRLASGRLAPQYTPDDAEIAGSVTLDELRAVFPGY